MHRLREGAITSLFILLNLLILFIVGLGLTLVPDLKRSIKALNDDLLPRLEVNLRLMEEILPSVKSAMEVVERDVVPELRAGIKMVRQ